ncbi:hypothetical protein [Azonexus sp.]|jgi:hypothetical protein|uniref:hypothetical protein n=1 Tax=Azonexus sp. TaxID=1872668 RepID=UPI0028304A45|nr:hypothetical protein [Azonexus sp.]MDR1995486.1 hypothetical protein [Azonexus sp.]
MSAPVDSVPLFFSDLAAGNAYLVRLPLTNPALAGEQLARFLDALMRQPPAPAVLFGLVEQARAPLHAVAEELARRYHGKPLPLAAEEDGHFRQVLAAWGKMAKAYALCARLEPPDTASPEYCARMATILHRCLYYTGMIILEHFRARRELPPGLWLELHGYYETAEEWGIACLPVRDALENGLQLSHCAAAYVALMLIEVASPYNHSIRDLNLIHRWATSWASLVSIHRLDDEFVVPPYVVELMQDAALHPSAASETLGPDARRFDTTRLGFQINHVLVQLHQRITPSQLGLGEETAGHVLPLLEQLLRPWAQQASPRQFRRFPSTGVARVASGFEAMHYFVGGVEFIQPDAASVYSRNEFDALFTFREQVSPGQALNIRPQVSYGVDEWVVLNHSAKGFRLGRSCVGQKMLQGQLVAVCPHDGKAYLLAQVVWLMQEEAGGLLAGLSMLPGAPLAAGIRPLAERGAVERYGRGFLLPALPAIGEEASLVAPAGTYRAGRALEVCQGDKTWQLRMLHVVQRGSDFERISYQAL